MTDDQIDYKLLEIANRLGLPTLDENEYGYLEFRDFAAGAVCVALKLAYELGKRARDEELFK